MFNPLCSSTKGTSAGQFLLSNGSHHGPTPKLTLFVVSNDEWDTKEGTGKFIKDALYIQHYAWKRHLKGC